jgi:hypothetical protein
MGSSGNPRSFLDLLDDQYAMVEAYANAQTLLYNAATTTAKTSSATTSGSPQGAFDDLDEDDELSSMPPTVRALERLEDAKWNLRSNFRDLREASRSDLHSRHLALSGRVITTIAGNPSWHANGLPNDTGMETFAQTALKANTVAIASLNASIARIKAIEGNDI